MPLIVFAYVIQQKAVLDQFLKGKKGYRDRLHMPSACHAKSSDNENIVSIIDTGKKITYE